MRSGALLFSTLGTSFYAASVSFGPDFAPMTVFHVNPLHEGVMPVNMDTADLHGDMFFDVHSKTVPIQCSGPASQWGRIDCTNGEVVDRDLVITKLQLHTRVSAGFGNYSRCNICNGSGVDPFSRLPCTPNEYFCTCGTYWDPVPCNEQREVGAENVTIRFGSWNLCDWDTWVRGPWHCWGFPAVDKIGGMWYSTTKAGWCDAPGADLQSCTWRATVDKVVNKSCSDNIIYQAVEAYDREHDQCFAGCGNASYGAGQARNTSDVCWIYCFYSTILGPKSLMPGAKPSRGVGMPLEELDAAFLKPFLPLEQGGCPDLAGMAPQSSWPRSSSADHSASTGALQARIYDMYLGRQRSSTHSAEST